MIDGQVRWQGIADAKAAAKAIRVAHEEKRPMKEVLQVAKIMYDRATDGQKEAFLSELQRELPAVQWIFEGFNR